LRLSKDRKETTDGGEAVGLVQWSKKTSFTSAAITLSSMTTGWA
jgi:hypothetical protein